MTHIHYCHMTYHGMHICSNILQKNAIIVRVATS